MNIKLGDGSFCSSYPRSDCILGMACYYLYEILKYDYYVISAVSTKRLIKTENQYSIENSVHIYAHCSDVKQIAQEKRHCCILGKEYIRLLCGEKNFQSNKSLARTKQMS
jgi:hypothetical protein